jgi:hypothetical protein
MAPMAMSTSNYDRQREAELALHGWRAKQLRRLGLNRYLAEVFADRIDWHAFADLVERGCTPALAFQITRP